MKVMGRITSPTLPHPLSTTFSSSTSSAATPLPNGSVDWRVHMRAYTPPRATQVDGARVRVVPARQQAQQGGLSGAGGAHNTRPPLTPLNGARCRSGRGRIAPACMLVCWARSLCTQR